MNRPLKFRAYSKKEKKMFSWKEMQTYNDLEYFFGQDKLLPCMQFTGLLDSKGKEIWESDIVKAYSLLGQNSFNCEVRWVAGGFVANGSLGVNNHTLEVIGNIYENPDL